MTGRLIALVMAAATGLGMLLYPQSANWFAVRNQASELTGYSDLIEAMPTTDQDAMLAAAQRYNDRILHAPVDPEAAPDPEYFALLSPQPSDVMARISIPSIGVDLPVYHGTGEDSLRRGAGHLYGTSLPLGGAGTHTVITAHSGLVNAELFTHLGQVRPADVVVIDVVGRTLFYKVQSISQIDPQDTSWLRIEPGQDRLSLLTCTPVGVNTHRLLVQATRISHDRNARNTLAGRDIDAGYPWWAVIWVGGIAVTAAAGRVALRPTTGPRRVGRTEADIPQRRAADPDR